MMETPLAVRQGVEEFNRQEFFQCHETLEHFWQGYQAADREFIQGLIQVAVAYHHLLRDNPEGARKLITRALPRLTPYLPHHMGIETEPLVDGIAATLKKLENGDSSDQNIPKIKLLLA
jgi:predicted metal-dependent hydrolase